MWIVYEWIFGTEIRPFSALLLRIDNACTFVLRFKQPLYKGKNEIGVIWTYGKTSWGTNLRFLHPILKYCVIRCCKKPITIQIMKTNIIEAFTKESVCNQEKVYGKLHLIVKVLIDIFRWDILFLFDSSNIFHVEY